MIKTSFKMLAVKLLCLVVVTHGLSIGKVSDKQNVTKRETGTFYPDWVPFKNKHGEELGEFVQVEKKAKPKKRLALPVNFVLKAVAEPQGDDYYDKGQGESDTDDYYEKKEWSDTNRPAQVVEADKPVNHTDISDIDGVVNIITKVKPDPIIDAIQRKSKENTLKAKHKEEESKEAKEEQSIENTQTDTESSEEKPKSESEKDTEKKTEKDEDDADYDEANSEQKKTERTEEEREAEEKKAKILSSVDELKERHAAEQRVISEKLKEEELSKEEHERDNYQSSEHKDDDKYSHGGHKKILAEYDEYDEKEPSLQEKYKIKPLQPKSTTTISPIRSTKRKGTKHEEEGKLSVFRNPQLYVVYDDDSEETTTKRTKTKSPTKTRENTARWSSRYTSTPATDSDESVRISLVPLGNESNEGEPTLFFPKKKKNKRRKKPKTTTEEPDTHVAETIADQTSKGLESIASVVSTTGSGSSEVTPSGPDATSTNSDSVADAVPASSDHKKEQPKHEDYEQEKGGERVYHSDHVEEHEESGKKAYEVSKPQFIHGKMVQQTKVKSPGSKPWYCNNVNGVHKDTKTSKGHHDKEDHIGKYDDHGGIDRHHHDEKNHYGSHHHEEHGKKHAKYEESGKHSKGHSTKGSHDVHKKEEYEKRVEFFEEEGDSGEEEKHGGFGNEKGHSSGGHFKKGNLDSGHHARAKGESGHFNKGGHGKMHKGHRQSGGHDSHGRHGKEKYEKEGHENGKKWIFHHGSPAKTANLVIIDRRADKYAHGPQYYG